MTITTKVKRVYIGVNLDDRWDVVEAINNFYVEFCYITFWQGMQILSNCENERKHRSVQNEQQEDLSPLLSRSNTLHEGDLRLKLK